MEAVFSDPIYPVPAFDMGRVITKLFCCMLKYLAIQLF